MKEPFVRFFRENLRPPQRPSAAGAQQPRIAFIDLAKGVCILLVVMMHAGLGHGFPGLRALRMPLYFMLSGLFFKDYGSFRLFVEKKVNKILVPFLFFALLGFADQALTALGEGRALTAYGLWQPFVSPSMTRSNLPVWFLVSLFWANLIYCAVSIHVGRLWLRTLAVFALGGAGNALSQGKVYLPLFFASSLTALPFFFAGSLLRRLPLLYAGRGRRLAPLLGVALVGAGAGFCAWFGTPAIDFRTNFYAGSPLIAFPLSVVLVVGLLLVCKGAGWLPVCRLLYGPLQHRGAGPALRPHGSCARAARAADGACPRCVGRVPLDGCRLLAAHPFLPRFSAACHGAARLVQT